MGLTCFGCGHTQLNMVVLSFFNRGAPTKRWFPFGFPLNQLQNKNALTNDTPTYRETLLLWSVPTGDVGLLRAHQEGHGPSWGEEGRIWGREWCENKCAPAPSKGCQLVPEMAHTRTLRVFLFEGCPNTYIYIWVYSLVAPRTTARGFPILRHTDAYRDT